MLRYFEQGWAGGRRMRVPFHRVQLNDAEIEAAAKVMRSGWLSTGEECAAFEREFAAEIGGGVEGVAVNSNTAGLHLALQALGIGPGDEVIVPVVTFTATAEVVRYLGADPVFADICPKTICITAEEIERKITPRTRAVMPVHFGGLTCDLTAIRELARRHDLYVVEDAAHAFPATHAGTKIGAHGNAAAVFSFYANKTITTGEGGMIVSENSDLIRRARVMRLHGIDRDAYRRFADAPSQWRYDVVAPGYKYNLTDIAAALGRKQLSRSAALHSARQGIALRYDRAFASLPLERPARSAAGDVHSHHLYVVQMGDECRLDRAAFLRHLESQEIGYSIHYTPLHRLSYWRDHYGLSDADFPHAVRYAERCVSLPLFPSMREEEVECVIAAVTGAFS